MSDRDAAAARSSASPSRAAGRAVVRDVSLEIPAGEVTALLGPNGAGKSSLVLAVGGVLRPRRARSARRRRISRAGGRRRSARAGVAVVPEGRRCCRSSRSRTTSTSPPTRCRSGRRERRAPTPSSCSPSSRRAATPARARSRAASSRWWCWPRRWSPQPKFVLIDELSLGLAPVVVKRLIPTIRTVAESGVGVLLIEQFATVALGLANRAYVMEGGGSSSPGWPSELREQARAAPVGLPAARQPDKTARKDRHMADTLDESADALETDADHPPLRGDGGRPVRSDTNS